MQRGEGEQARGGSGMSQRDMVTGGGGGRRRSGAEAEQWPRPSGVNKVEMHGFKQGCRVRLKHIGAYLPV